MLRLLRDYVMSEQDQARSELVPDGIAFEAVSPPVMTCELAGALAQLVRAALARRSRTSGRAA
ncbi:MAG: hypothetical protein ACRDX8_09640 [Acidimicrobiales bacterium]